MIFRKWGRGQRPFGTLLKIHPFWRRHPTLMIIILTPKNAFVDPQQKVPYLILVCLARSSAEFTGEDIFDAVRKAGHENLINFFFSWSTNLPSLRCRRISWWGWRTTTCRPPSWSRSPWWWCGATLNMVDTVRQWKLKIWNIQIGPKWCARGAPLTIKRSQGNRRSHRI